MEEYINGESVSRRTEKLTKNSIKSASFSVSGLEVTINWNVFRSFIQSHLSSGSLISICMNGTYNFQLVSISYDYLAGFTYTSPNAVMIVIGKNNIATYEGSDIIVYYV
jgi:hypothetical protein